jgi:predicted nucleic acid-binding protein
MLPGSKHRSTPAIDLLVAAAAIEADMPLIHRDRDFETIGELTRQPLRWLGPR